MLRYRTDEALHYLLWYFASIILAIGSDDFEGEGGGPRQLKMLPFILLFFCNTFLKKYESEILFIPLFVLTQKEILLLSVPADRRQSQDCLRAGQ